MQVLISIDSDLSMKHLSWKLASSEPRSPSGPSWRAPATMGDMHISNWLPSPEIGSSKAAGSNVWDQ